VRTRIDCGRGGRMLARVSHAGDQCLRVGSLGLSIVVQRARTALHLHTILSNDIHHRSPTAIRIVPPSEGSHRLRTQFPQLERRTPVGDAGIECTSDGFACCGFIGELDCEGESVAKIPLSAHDKRLRCERYRHSECHCCTRYMTG